MSPATLEAAIRFAYAESGRHLDLTFFGGEPLLEKELIRRAVEYSERHRAAVAPAKPVRYFVTTNGLLCDGPFLDFCRAARVKPTLSLDGYGAGHDRTRTLPDGSGSFDAIARNFDAILGRYPLIDVLTTFSPASVAGLADGVIRLRGRGFRRFFIGGDYESAWTEADYGEMRRQFEALGSFYIDRIREGDDLYLSVIDSKIASRAKAGCELGPCCCGEEGEIAVAPSGNLYPCLRFVKTDTDEALRIGSLATGLDRVKRARIMARSGRECPACAACAHRGRCFHYCGAVNHKTTGAFEHPPAALCREEQAAIAVADEVAALLYRERTPAFLARYYGGQG